MPIIPLRVEFENFLCFKEKQEFLYSHTGIHYIYGVDTDIDVQEGFSREQYNIGVGKTSLAMLMQFAFYGKIQKKINMDQIINKFTRRDLYVQFDFILNGEEYRIERYRKHRLYDNDVFLYRKVKGKFENVSQAEKRETQNEINKLIVLDIRTFEKSILFTREDKIQFLELPTIDRGMIFENIAQINKLRDYWDKAKKKLRELEDNISVVNNHILTFSTVINRDKEYIEDLNKRYAKQKKEIDDDINKIETEISTISSVDINEIAKLHKEYVDHVKEMSSTASFLESFNNQYDLLNSKYESNEKIIKQNKLQIDRLNDRIKDLKPITCNNCGAVQNEKEYKELSKKLKDELKMVQTNYDALVKENKENKDKLSEAKYEIEMLEERYYEADVAHEKLHEQIPEIFIKDPNKIDYVKVLNDKLNILRAQLQTIDVTEDIKSIQKDIEEKSKELDVHVKNKNELMLQKRMLDFWCDVLDFKTENSLKQYVISKIIPLFNHLLQQILDAVYHSDMVISFDNFFQETILYKDENTLYDELSTGEKAKLNFCIYLAIFDLTRINLDGSKVIFMDEIFNNVDLPTIITFLNIIRERYSKENGVYIISHQAEVKENLNPDSIIKIEKRENASKVILEGVK